MSRFQLLKDATTINDIASLLNYKAKTLSYILYVLSKQDDYYTSFEVPKKNGGVRLIQAPNKKLKQVQTNLSGLLNECVNEIIEKEPKYFYASHGFLADKTIITNANKHKKKRYVFNVDIENFFGSINFGRVMGFFMNDRHFRLDKKVATIIAQIACHENALPQGSPCSPIISNLIGNIIDIRLITLAKKHKCTYTRYADDITFSTNVKQFPTSIAKKRDETWEVGTKLSREIQKLGFNINEKKTRMSFNNSQQMVTGIVVNKKINFSQAYYRELRSQCHNLFKNGSYHVNNEVCSNLNKLQGKLAYLYFIQNNKKNIKIDKNEEANFGSGLNKLYRKFLFYKYFVASEKPVIVTEGATDIGHLKLAIDALDEKDMNLKFFNPSKTGIKLLNLGEGTGGQNKLIFNYRSMMNKLGKNMPAPFSPVILLCDNDEGASDIFKTINNKKNKFSCEISLSTTDPFYKLCHNLYLIKVPESKGAETSIEDLYEETVLDTKLGEKTFNKTNKKLGDNEYGKQYFLDYVVRKNKNSIDFSGFTPLLDRIKLCISNWESQEKSSHNSTNSH
ncbi:MAG: hypothetical protein CSA42_01055 [Gammaproteobacteria bacterium]|nr:MAG: hypothetical protein CSA42_01055 [Gammaproteobacteria bacterium]